MPDQQEAHRRGPSRNELAQLVRCLSCGFAYRQPAARGGWYDNPGCPRCGYAGWARFWSNLPLGRSTDDW